MRWRQKNKVAAFCLPATGNLLILGLNYLHIKNSTILYARTSTLQQKTDRQLINQSEYSLVIEDKCSGTIPFFERPGGKKIKQILDKETLTELAVWEIDRLGRDLRDILNTIHYFTERKVCIHFISQSLRTIDGNGKDNPISRLIISVLGVVGEMERNQIRERQLEGIAIAKQKGVYRGRREGSTEDVLKFLSKPKNSKALSYLKKGFANSEASKLSGVHINTVTKIKKFGFMLVKKEFSLTELLTLEQVEG